MLKSLSYLPSLAPGGTCISCQFDEHLLHVLSHGDSELASMISFLRLHMISQQLKNYFYWVHLPYFPGFCYAISHNLSAAMSFLKLEMEFIRLMSLGSALCTVLVINHAHPEAVNPTTFYMMPQQLSYFTP